MTAVRRGSAVDMTQGNPLRLILLFALPVLLGQLFQQLYTISDTMIAGHYLGDNALASIGASASLYSMILSFAMGIANGCGIVLGRMFGMRDMPRLRRASGAMILLNLLVGVSLTAIMLLLCRPMLVWLHTPAAVFEQAHSYLAILCGGFVVTVMYNACAAFMQALGNSRTALYFLVISCVLNLLLDVVMVMLLDWGVQGAALATVMAQGVSALLSMLYIRRHFAAYLPARKDRPDRRLMGEMASTGLAMGLMYSVYAIGSVVMQGAINSLGAAVITAHTGARKILELMMKPAAALGTAASAFVSQNRGAGQWARIRTALRQVEVMVAAWSLMVTVILYGAGESLIRGILGTGNAEIVRLAVMNLCINAPLYLPEGILVTMRQAMQSLGMKVVPVLASSIELVMKLLCAWLVVPAWGYLGASWGEPSTWAVCAVFIVAVYFARRKKIYPDLA
ncbi:MAG: MATE family efflux transporter [Aristaeellaceae bacterium]